MVLDRPPGPILHASACLLLLASTPGAVAQVSNSFQIDPAHTGSLQTPEHFTPPLQQKWAVDLGAPISYPVIADGLVFVTTAGYPDTGEKVFALSTSTGKVVWEQFVGGGLSEAYLTWLNGTIFALGSNGIIEASDATTGRLKWTVQITDQLSFGTPPVAAAGALYVVGDESGSTLYRINAATGAIEWKVFADNFGLPALGQGTVIGGQDCSAYAIAAESAAVSWQTNITCGSGKSVAAVFSDKSFVGWPLYNGPGTLLDSQSGTIKSTLSGSAPARWDNLLIQAVGKLTATDAKTEKVVWTLNSTESFNIPPVVINDVAYALSASGTLYAMSPKNGNVIQILTPGVGTHPIAGTDMITGLGAGPSILVVPSVSLLTAYGPP